MESESRSALLAVAVPLIAFKVWFAILLLSYAPTREGVVWIAATHWPLVIIIALLLAGPGLATYRLMRVRARREKLRRAEWMLGSVAHAPAVDVDKTAEPAAQCSALWETVSRLEGGE
jgi:hypothetical protein